MTETYRLRRGTPDDTEACVRILVAAVTDLGRRQGTSWEADPADLRVRLGSMLDHLALHAAEWWVAEDAAGGALIGYARSTDRGGLFELTEFFVHPDHQAAGLGADLLARAFPDGRGEVRAIIATTDLRAQSRYYRAGTVARFPIVSLEVAEPRPLEVPSDAALVRATPDDIADLRRIDAAVLDYDRGDEFTWLIEDREGWLLRRDGKAVGYAFVGRHGSGPIATLDPDDQLPLLALVESRAAALGVTPLTLEVPMHNGVAMRHLLARGFRMDAFFTFLMSSHPFGRFDRYVVFGPPFIL
jgi:GNAT superfamily N-acetyltransferase